MEKSAIDQEFYIDESSNSSSSFEQRHNNNRKQKRGGGVLKRSSIVQQIYLGVDFVRRKTFIPHLYPTHSQKLSGKKQQQKRRVRFRPVINVVRIQSHKEMPPNEKLDVWWQLLDLERFKTEIKMLSNEQEPIDYRRFSGNHSKMEGETKDDCSEDDDDANCWWHKYGDSRRGVEKCAYGQEAQETMEFAKRSVAAVVEKQLLEDEAKEEEEEEQIRLAVLYHEYSAWATDLALAWAASDADAVKTDFDESKRKSREFYLVKQLMKHQQKIHKHSPSFMIPNGIPTKGYLNDQQLLLRP